jgi:hypothetical protein
MWCLNSRLTSCLSVLYYTSIMEHGMELTQQILQDLLNYDPDSGIWTWRNPLPRSKMKPGDLAGRITSHGRRQIRIASGFYYSARLAFLYMTGDWPVDQVDHINRIRDDDRWINLREATQSQNSFNRTWCEASGEMRGITVCGWQYAVKIGNTYLGLFPGLDLAKTARDEALQILGGSFTNLPERNVT